MGEINIDYFSWKNSTPIEIAKKVDSDGIKGLSGQEIIDFKARAKSAGFDDVSVNELLGASFERKSPAAGVKTTPEFDKAAEYYNTKMTDLQKQDVTYKTYEVGERRLHDMETKADKAFEECEAYSDIILVQPRWPWRRRNIVDFDLKETKENLEKDMESLNELKDKIQLIIEEANGIETHTPPEKIEYDFNQLALVKLGMPYEDFINLYGTDFKAANPSDAYFKAKAFAQAMVDYAREQAHEVRWDYGEKLQDETFKYLDDMTVVSDFEYTGVTKSTLSELSSGIMFKAFEETLIAKYNELNPEDDAIDDIKQDNVQSGSKKIIVNGAILIQTPNGSLYDISGKKIK